MALLKYTFSRTLRGVVSIFVIVTIAFFAIRLVPGDPVDVWLGDYATPELIAQTTQAWGLDKPLVVQYFVFLRQLAKGDLGTSLRANASVTYLIGEVFPYTVRLMIAGAVLSVFFGVLVGAFAAVRHNSFGDVASMTACMVFLSIPGFVLGYLLIYLFAVTWRIFPVIGGEKAMTVAALWKHLTLPALSLGLGYAGTIARMTRSTMVEVLNSDYIRTARSKGLRQSTIVFKHAMRNTLTSLVSMIGVQIIVMLGGLVVTETVFSRPGLGRLYFTAVSARDYPLMQGSILVIAVCVVVVTFLVDISYGIIDPRIQYT